MIFDVINPSDAVTLEASSVAIAGLTAIILGQGKYGLRDESGDSVLPIMLFGLDDWMDEQELAVGVRRDERLQKAMEANRADVAACMRTAMACSVKDRAALAEAMRAGGGDYDAALKTFNESRRTSMNNICGRATQYAEALEEQARRTSA